jgi:hypothetical protein
VRIGTSLAEGGTGLAFRPEAGTQERTWSLMTLSYACEAVERPRADRGPSGPDGGHVRPGSESAPGRPGALGGGGGGEGGSDPLHDPRQKKKIGGGHAASSRHRAVRGLSSGPDA